MVLTSATYPTTPPGKQTGLVAEVAGLLLTGGSSSRLGQDKAALFAGRIAKVLCQVASPVFEVGPGRTGLPSLRDPGEGPLGALRCAPAHDSLVLACDLPAITVDVLRWLADQPGTAIPVVEGRAQYLCARYSSETLLLARTVEGDRMRDLLDVADDVHYVDASEWPAECFADVDTPEDLDRLQ